MSKTSLCCNKTERAAFNVLMELLLTKQLLWDVMCCCGLLDVWEEYNTFVFRQ